MHISRKTSNYFKKSLLKIVYLNKKKYYTSQRKNFIPFYMLNFYNMNVFSNIQTIIYLFLRMYIEQIHFVRICYYKSCCNGFVFLLSQMIPMHFWMLKSGKKPKNFIKHFFFFFSNQEFMIFHPCKKTTHKHINLPEMLRLRKCLNGNNRDIWLILSL